MAKPRIVLVDTDTEYLLALEVRMVEAFGESIELEVIDDTQYLDEFLSRALRMDILVVSERLCDQRILQSDVGRLYRLTEEEGFLGENSNILNVFKYANFQKIFSEIEFGAKQFVRTSTNETQRTKTILVYSAIGGAGKTTVALGLCENLVAIHKKVLYIDAENIQDFAYYLREKSCLPTSALNESFTSDELYNSLRPYIKNEGFDYLPPLKVAASALDISLEIYQRIIEVFQRHVQYDYVIVDTDSAFDDNKDMLIQLAEKVVLITNPGEAAQYKMDLFMSNLSAPDSEKYLTICNRILNANNESDLSRCDYYISTIDGAVRLNTLIGNADIEKIAYLL